MPNVIGWKLWRWNSQTLQPESITSRDISWELSPSDGVLAVAVFFDGTYQIWKCNYDEHGGQVNGRWETERYRKLLHSGDYYWMGTVNGELVFGTGNIDPGQPIVYPWPDVLTSVPGAIKTGQNIPNSRWWDFYNLVKEERR